jgi:hypothetical protein
MQADRGTGRFIQTLNGNNAMPVFVRSAKQVLAANEEVLFGVFGVIGRSKAFPPREFLNEFFARGNDPCDQDGRMGEWHPFTVSQQEYLDVKDWWIAAHPGVVADDLGAANWDDWIQEILNL